MKTQLLKTISASIIISIGTVFFSASAQNYFMKSYTNGIYNSLGKIIPTRDHNFIVIGKHSDSSINLYLLSDFMTKFDSNGNEIWSRIFNVNAYDRTDIVETKDGGFALVGIDFSDLIKTDSVGNVLYSYNYGLTQNSLNAFSNVIPASDNGLFLVGNTKPPANKPGFSATVLKVDSDGVLQWVNSTLSNYGYSDNYGYSNAQPTNDGGVFAVGSMGGKEILIARYDSSGNMLWEKTIASANILSTIQPNSVITSKEGGYYISGYENFYTEDSTLPFFLKIDENGNLLKHWSYGFTPTSCSNCLGASIVGQNNDGSLFVIGSEAGSKLNQSPFSLIADSSGNIQYGYYYGDSTKSGGALYGSFQHNSIFLSGVFNDLQDTFQTGSKTEAFLFKTPLTGEGPCLTHPFSLSKMNDSLIVNDIPISFINRYLKQDTITVTSSVFNNVATDFCLATGIPNGAVKNNILHVYPNPSSSYAIISFSLTQSETVSIQIFDVEGRLIRTLANANIISDGTHTLNWDARDERGNAVSAGIYLLRMQTGNESKTITLSVVK